MDRQSVYSAHVYEPTFGENGDTRLQLQTQLETFILDFRLDNNFVYRFALASYMFGLIDTDLPIQRPATGECTPQEILLRHQSQ